MMGKVLIMQLKLLVTIVLLASCASSGEGSADQSPVTIEELEDALNVDQSSVSIEEADGVLSADRSSTVKTLDEAIDMGKIIIPAAARSHVVEIRTVPKISDTLNACSNSKVLFSQMAQLSLTQLDQLYGDNSAYNSKIQTYIVHASSEWRNLKNTNEVISQDQRLQFESKINCLNSYSSGFSAFRSYIKGGQAGAFLRALSSARENNPEITRELYNEVLIATGLIADNKRYASKVTKNNSKEHRDSKHEKNKEIEKKSKNKAMELYVACKNFKIRESKRSFQGIKFSLMKAPKKINNYILLTKDSNGKLQVARKSAPYSKMHEMWKVEPNHEILIKGVEYQIFCITPGGRPKMIHLIPKKEMEG